MDHMSSWYYAAHQATASPDPSYVYFEWLKQQQLLSSPPYNASPYSLWQLPQTPVTPGLPCGPCSSSPASSLEEPSAFFANSEAYLNLCQQSKVAAAAATTVEEVSGAVSPISDHDHQQLHKCESKQIQCCRHPKRRDIQVQTLCCPPGDSCHRLSKKITSKLNIRKKSSSRQSSDQLPDPWTSYRSPAHEKVASKSIFDDVDSDSECQTQTSLCSPLRLKISPLDSVVISDKKAHQHLSQSSTPCRKKVGVVRARLRGHQSPSNNTTESSSNRPRRRLDKPQQTTSSELDLLCLAADIERKRQHYMKQEGLDDDKSSWPDVNSVSNLTLTYDLARVKGLELDPEKPHFEEAQDSSTLVHSLESVWKLLELRRKQHRQQQQSPSTSSNVRKRRRTAPSCDSIPTNTTTSTTVAAATSSPAKVEGRQRTTSSDRSIDTTSSNQGETPIKKSKRSICSRPPTPEMRSCQLSVEDLREGQRLLISLEGLWYAGLLHEVEPPDVYRISLDGCLRNRHHYLTREELLSGAVLEMKPSSQTELPAGTRVCAHWSNTLTALYPGTVKSTEPRDIHISFDDEDEKTVCMDWVRMLPADAPVVPHVGRQPQAELKPRAARLKSRTNSTISQMSPTTTGGSERRRYHSAANSGESAVLFEWADSGKRRGRRLIHNQLLRNGVSISVGDSVMFKSTSDRSFFFGEILSFWEEDSDRRMWVEAAWYYQPCEMGLAGKALKSLQGKVLLRSRHQDPNEARTILKKITILEDISDKRIQDLPDDTYFLAGDYDASLGKVNHLSSIVEQQLSETTRQSNISS